MQSSTNLVWLDLEMTGLNVATDVILEIASVVTDGDLNILAQGPSLVIYQPEEKLALMDAWVKDQHGKSGLTGQVRASQITLEQAEQETLAFIETYCLKRKSILCGNSIWQDVNFLRRYMPRIVDYMHYRVLDVSAFKEAVTRWYPQSPYKEFKKKDMHRAMIDTLESIEELKHYRKYFFVPGE